MTQASILAPGNAAATSSDVVVPAGETVTVGLYSATADAFPNSIQMYIYQATPGADNLVSTLGNYNRSTVLVGPGTFRIKRTAYTGPAFGAFSEV
tara:strand:- start:11970 stop:12254 length:285 start_codon:yes stop_codon:yes gene_type:complete